MNRLELEELYIKLGNKIQEQNPLSSFKNHCYWRIANDAACQANWTKVVSKPFYKKASDDQLKKSVKTLEQISSKRLILTDYNRQSLNYRK